MVRVKSYPHHALTFTPTPVMPMNKGIEPMGESVRVKTAITFICERMRSRVVFCQIHFNT